jgi:molybdopterin synthase catalytic subunit
MRTRIAIQHEAFDFNAEIAALAADGTAGAVASFSGHVRAEDGLSGLTLEHYPGMTEAEIARMADDAAARWPVTGITIIHRIGTLRPGDSIVLVAVASAHRAEAFAACEFLMDWLKTSAPFWKEELRGSETHWVESRASDEASARRWARSDGQLSGASRRPRDLTAS